MSRITLITGLLLLSLSAAASANSEGANGLLGEVLAAQPGEAQERYSGRHPQETLEFFGIEPGMTVVEGLPGSGWYSRILMSYLGPEGRLVGADYSAEMFPLFGFFSDEQLAAKATWVTDWTTEAVSWGVPDAASVVAFQFGSLPEDMKGTADAVIMIRALHNLARFESQGGFLSAAVADIVAVLKPGGTLGVVQHMARDEMPDAWADGSRGYLKDDFVIKLFTEAGLEFAGMSDINFNELDQPGEADVVWRLPPTLATSRENPDLQEQMKAIGESNRMTVKFRKPE